MPEAVPEPDAAPEPAAPELAGAGAVPLGAATPTKLPVRGPGAAVANAFTPESAGAGGATLGAAAASAANDENVFPVAGALMALRTYEREWYNENTNETYPTISEMQWGWGFSWAQ